MNITAIISTIYGDSTMNAIPRRIKFLWLCSTLMILGAWTSQEQTYQWGECEAEPNHYGCPMETPNGCDLQSVTSQCEAMTNDINTAWGGCLTATLEAPFCVFLDPGYKAGCEWYIQENYPCP